MTAFASPRAQFSPSQLRAVESEASETLVAAAAGSGKTSVLTERFFDLVQRKKISPDRIAAITFTDKAAAELAVRLSKRFEEADKRDVAPLLERGFIATIHGLCRKLLSEFPIEAGIDPAFSVIDEDFAVLLRRQAMERAFESACSAGRYAGLFKAFWIQRLEKPLDSALSKWRSGTEEPRAVSLSPDWPRVRSRLEEAMRALRIDLPVPDFECLDSDPEPWPALEALDEVIAAVKGRKGETATELREAILAARLAVGDAASWPHARDFSELLKEFGREYVGIKETRACLDFDDLLHHTVRLLKDDAVAATVRRRFDAVLVDEYQDVNPLQALMIDRLTGRRDVFYVGDVRQSIYAFRFADCGQFVAKARFGCLSMDENHRSRPHLIAFVNAIFNDRFATAGVPYGAMIATRPSINSAPPVEFLLQPGVASDGISELRAGEALAIAGRIRAMIDDVETACPKGEGHPRPIRYGDIAVLLPQMTDIEIYERALRRAGIPYHLVKGKGFYYKIEVQDIMNALQSLARPDDWGASMACAKSPLGGLSDDALYQVRRMSGDLGFFETLRAGIDACGLLPVDAARAERLLAWYSKLRSTFHGMEIPKVINAILEATDYDAGVLAMPGGQRRYLNLQKLKHVAVAFERHAGGGIERFVAYVKDLSVRQAQEQEALLDAGGSDAVHVLTVHAAKGLEFPVVFVAGCGIKPAKSKIQDGGGFMIGDRLEVTCALPDPSGDGFLASGAHEAAIEAAFSKSLEEWDRLLYVALTRATDRLICTAAWKRPKGPSKSKSHSWLDVLAGPLPQLLSMDASGLLEMAGLSVAVSVGEGFAPTAKFARPEERQVAPDAARVARRLAPVRREYWQTLSFTVSQIVAFENGVSFSGSSAPSHADIRGAADAAAYGNAYHYVLQHVDYSGDVAAEVRTLLGAFAPRFGAAALAALEASAVRFLLNPEAARIRDAWAARRGVYRELPFLYRVPREVESKRGVAEDLGFIRGQVDLLYQDESGGWTLIDYKTGAPKPAEHFRQVQLYAFCLERLLGDPIGRARVHYAESGEFLEVPLNHLSDRAFERNLISVFEHLCGQILMKNPRPANHCG